MGLHALQILILVHVRGHLYRDTVRDITAKCSLRTKFWGKYLYLQKMKQEGNRRRCLKKRDRETTN
jgi:hypothetical protein